MAGRKHARASQLVVLLVLLPVVRLPAAGSVEAPAARTVSTRSGIALATELTFPVDAQRETLTFGAGAGFLRYRLVPWLPLFSTDLELSYALFPIAPGSLSSFAADERIDSLRLGAGLTGRLPIGPRFSVIARGSIGGAASAAGFAFPPRLAWYWSGAAGVGVRIDDAIALRLEACYVDHADLARSVSAGVGFDFSWPPPSTGPTVVEPSRSGSLPAVQPASSAPLRGGMRQQPPSDSHPVAMLQEGPIRELTARVRAIHDWIATNIAYDANAFYGTAATITEPLAVIRHGASVCQGYSNLFQRMCGMADIECEVVSGCARGIGFDPSKDSTAPCASNHAWNAVRIGDLWYLIDCTWDAGYVDSRTKSFGALYETSYLFSDPRAFLHTHFPGDPRWQLIEAPISYEEFRGLPYLTGRFFQHGLALSDGVALVTKADNRMEFIVSAP